MNDDLRAAAQAATPGPWEWQLDEENHLQGTMKVARLQSQTAVLPSPVWNLRVPKRVMTQESWYVFPDEADRDYLALASPDRILALCDDNKELREALEAILIRTDEGDPRSDWLPIISRLAHAALEGKPG